MISHDRQSSSVRQSADLTFNTPSGDRSVTQDGAPTTARGQQSSRGRGLANGRVHGDRRGRGRGRGGAWSDRRDRRLDTRDCRSVGGRTAGDTWLDSWLAGGVTGAGAGGEAMEHDGAIGRGSRHHTDSSYSEVYT